MKFFAPAARGLDYLLVDELEALGAEEVAAGRAGVRFQGDLAIGYRACLWSRLASRILLPLAEFDASDADALYAGVRDVDWARHLRTRSTIAVRASTAKSQIDHSHFAALRVKDAIVDQCRDERGWRPNVDTEQPDLVIDLYLRSNRATVSLDLAGRPLHRRGYRIAAGPAPLKETLAAAVLIRGGWPRISAGGGALFDPMCGSGTLLIEAALMVADQAPGLADPTFAFQRWEQHEPTVWAPLLEEARGRWEEGRRALADSEISGADVSGRALHAARQNLVRANLSPPVKLHKCALDQLPDLATGASGLVVTNPPYGERVQHEDLARLYRDLGGTLRERFPGWRAALLVADDDLSRATGLRADKRYRVYNGALPCRIVVADIGKQPEIGERRPLGSDALMARNRLSKNLRRLRKRLAREGVTCFRLYDADLPEYAAAVDIYESHAHVQEYAPPRSVPKAKAARRFRDLCQAVAEVMEFSPERVIAKQRRRQRGVDQYQRTEGDFAEFVVGEGGLKFKVSLTRYMDTGLFLDHRLIRAQIREQARSRRFLNLFSYTGTASVYAASGGASTTSVDLSNTYGRWARENLALNGFSDENEHRVIRGDCLQWLAKEADQYDLVLVDPPTWSNTKTTVDDFSVQTHHARLLELAFRRLAPGGTLWFSTNFRQFKLDDTVASLHGCTEITSHTVPFDFVRRRPHRCWRFQRSDSA